MSNFIHLIVSINIALLLSNYPQWLACCFALITSLYFLTVYNLHTLQDQSYIVSVGRVTVWTFEHNGKRKMVEKVFTSFN